MAQNIPLQTLLKSLEDNQAIDVEVINVQTLTSITDFMIVCSGRSSRHVYALADHLMTDMKKAGILVLSKHGIEEGEWALVDFGDFIVHIMQPHHREYYNLEGLWQLSETSRRV